MSLWQLLFFIFCDKLCVCVNCEGGFVVRAHNLFQINPKNNPAIALLLQVKLSEIIATYIFL